MALAPGHGAGRVAKRSGAHHNAKAPTCAGRAEGAAAAAAAAAAWPQPHERSLLWPGAPAWCGGGDGRAARFASWVAPGRWAPATAERAAARAACARRARPPAARLTAKLACGVRGARGRPQKLLGAGDRPNGPTCRPLAGRTPDLGRSALMLSRVAGAWMAWVVGRGRSKRVRLASRAAGRPSWRCGARRSPGHPAPAPPRRPCCAAPDAWRPPPPTYRGGKLPDAAP
jgi:hypothetical protein